MTRGWLVALATIGLVACSNPAEEAERGFEIASNSGTYADMCRQATDAADAWLKQGDSEKFERWRLTRDIYCASARTDPDGSPSLTKADNERALSEARQTAQEMQNSVDPQVRSTAQGLESWLDTANRAE